MPDLHLYWTGVEFSDGETDPGVPVDCRRALILLSITVLAAGLTCSRAPRAIGPGGDQSVPDFSSAATGTASVVQTQRAIEEQAVQETGAAQMTAAAGPSATPTPDPAAAVEIDFSGDSIPFIYSAEKEIQDGELLFGPSESCALDRPNYLDPIGCIALCSTCISQTGSYRMLVDWQYADGVSERTFGVILRFVDENGDGLLGDEDYFLALGMNVFTNDMNIYLHEPGSGTPLQLLETVEGGYAPPPAMNTIEIISSSGGREMDVLVDGGRIFRLRGYSSEPGETFIEPWVDSGSVGLVLLQRGVQARYDNFSFRATSD